MKIFFETERTYLREILESDVEGMFALDSNPIVHKYLGNRPVKTREQSLAMIRDIRQQYIDNGIGRFAVIHKETEEFMGWSCLKFEHELGGREKYYDLGYRFREEYWRKGYASETAIASVKYGFDVLNLKEIYGAADVDNIGSNKILQIAGLKYVSDFHFEGTPHKWYGISQEEWRKENS